jgi:hypothetical protein
MSVWQSKVSTIVVIVLSLISISCKKGLELSGSIQPDELKLDAFFTDQLELNTSIVYFDSISNSNSSRLLVGRLHDPIVGEIVATPYFRLRSPSLFANWGPNVVFDSIKISLRTQTDTAASRRNRYYYNKQNSTSISIDIHELTEQINPNNLGFIYNTVSYKPEKLASVTLENDLKPEILIKLPDELGQRLINNPASFATIDGFQELLKGFALIPSSSSENIVSIYDVELLLFYHNKFGFGNFVSKNFYRMPAAFTFFNRTAIQNITVNKSGTYIANLSQNYDSVKVYKGSDQFCIVQNNTGLFTRVEFPNLIDFSKSIEGKLLVNRAVLEIYPDTVAMKSVEVPNSLFVLMQTNSRKVERDSKDNLKYLQAPNSSVFNNNNSASVAYNPTTKRYAIDLTTYLQAIIDGNLPNNGLLIGAQDDQVSTSFGIIQQSTLKRLLFKNGGTDSNIKLNLYYTPYK